MGRARGQPDLYRHKIRENRGKFAPHLSYSCDVMQTQALFCAGKDKFDSRMAVEDVAEESAPVCERVCKDDSTAHGARSSRVPAVPFPPVPPRRSVRTFSVVLTLRACVLGVSSIAPGAPGGAPIARSSDHSRSGQATQSRLLHPYHRQGPAERPPIYAHTYTCNCAHMHICTCAHMYSCTHACVHLRSRVCAGVHVCTFLTVGLA
jgi:hypothetical protein